MQTVASPPKTLTAAQVAAELACSRATVYRAVARGELAAVRLGERGSLRIRRDALERFLHPTPAEETR